MSRTLATLVMLAAAVLTVGPGVPPLAGGGAPPTEERSHQDPAESEGETLLVTGVRTAGAGQAPRVAPVARRPADHSPAHAVFTTPTRSAHRLPQDRVVLFCRLTL